MEPDRPAPGSSHGACLGKYRVLSHLATGGMGVVYKALDPDTGREVALKVLKPELLASKPALLERLRREAQVGARLRHENIVSLYELVEAGGTYFLVMEFVDGSDLHEHIHRHGPLAPDEARLIVIQVARALHYADSQRVVHRDIKPANILLAHKDGRPVAKLADLGLARQVDAEEFRVTQDGCTVGTVDYMAPEQARDSAAADIRSDIYSLGCTFYYLLAGTPPFAEGSLPERIYKHAEAEPPDVRLANPDVPADLAGVLRRMLAKKPSDRYQSPVELLKHLDAHRQAARSPTPAALRPAPRPAPALRPRPARSLDGPAPSTTNETVSAAARLGAGQYVSAREHLAHGNLDYGIDLLLGCCQLDPGNLSYHRALQRALEVRPAAAQGDSLLRRLRGLVAWVRLGLARLRGDPTRVLARGAEFLMHRPGDLTTQVRMAEAARGLNLDELALWLLEQAHQQEQSNVEVHRALGRLHEVRKEYTEAIASWGCVARLASDDAEAERKLRDLAALQTLQKQQLRMTADRGAEVRSGRRG